MQPMHPPIRLLTWTPLLEPRLARARQPPQSPPCATPNPENCFDCVPEAHASLMRAGRRRHTTERDGTRRTEGHGLPEPCRRAPPLALRLLVAVAHGNRIRIRPFSLTPRRRTPIADSQGIVAGSGTKCSRRQSSLFTTFCPRRGRHRGDGAIVAGDEEE